MSEKIDVKIYSATSGYKKGMASVLTEMFRDFRLSTDLGYQIAKRDIQALYRKSLLGIFWAFISPLMTALVWIFLNGMGVVKINVSGMPYPAFVLAGTMMWTIFSESVMAVTAQTQSSKSIMSKINFPKEGLLIAAFYKLFFNNGIKLIMLIGMFIALGVLPGWQIIFVPFLILTLAFFGFMIGLFVAPIGLLYGDVARGLPLLMQLIMYLSPVVYQIPQEGILRKIMLANPVTPLLANIRNLMSGGEFQQPIYFISIIAVSLLLSLVGWMLYRLSMPIIIER